MKTFPEDPRTRRYLASPKPKGTIDRKVKVDDRVYVLRVPNGSSLDPRELFQKGIVLSIKAPGNLALDVYGRALKGAAVTWNPLSISAEAGMKDLDPEFTEAMVRSKAAIDNFSQGKVLLHQLSVAIHRGERIQRDDADPDRPYYYIPRKAYCDNCHLPIPGRTPLEINENGKVARELKFVPDDPKVQRKENSEKLLHAACGVKAVVPDDPKPQVIVERHELRAAAISSLARLKDLEGELEILRSSREKMIKGLLGVVRDGTRSKSWRLGAVEMYLILAREEDDE